MDIGKKVHDLLTSLKVPVARLKYSGKKIPYIVWQEYLEQGEAWESDKESYTAHYIQVNVYNDKDSTELCKQVKDKLITNEFIREEEHDIFESGTQLFCRVLRFVYYENIDQ